MISPLSKYRLVNPSGDHFEPVEQELAARVFPAADPVSQGSRSSPLGLASRYLEAVRSSLDSRDYDAVASRTSFAADRTSETTSAMSESVVR